MRWKSIAVLALCLSVANLLPHLPRRRATGNHDTSLGRLRMVARVSSGIYLTQELIKGDHVDEITSELLKMGDAKVSEVVAMDEAGILDVVNSMKDLQLEDSTSLGFMEKKLEVLAEAQRGLKDVADVAVWNGKADFESAVNGMKSNFAPVKAAIDFKTKAGNWESDIQRVLDKDPSAMSPFVTELKDASKIMIGFINAMSPDNVIFTTTGSAVESFSQPAVTASAVKQSITFPNGWNSADVAAFEKNLKSLYNISSNMFLILSQLQSIESILRMRTDVVDSSGLVHTDGLFKGPDDLTALANDLSDPWMGGVSNSSSHLEKAMSGLKALINPMKDYLTRLGVPTDAELTTIRSLIQKAELVVTASEKPQETLGAAKTARDCDKDNVAPREFDGVIAVAEVTQKLDRQLAYLRMSLQRVSDVVKRKNIVSLLQSLHDKCEQMTDMAALKTAIKDEFDGDKLRDSIKNLSTLIIFDDNEVKTTAQDIAAKFPAIATFYTDMANYKKIFNCIKPIEHLDLVGKAVSAIRSARAPPGTLFADSAPLIQKVTGVNNELRSVQNAVNGLKGKKSKESDALDLLTEPQATSSNIGKAVQGVVMADEVEKKTSEVDKVIEHMDSIASGLSGAVGLSSEDVLNLQKLVNLKKEFEKLKEELSTWKVAVSAEQFDQLVDGSKFTTPTRQVQGVQADLAPLIGSLEHLITAAPNSPSLVLLKDSLKSLSTLHLDFSTYTSSLDAAANSLSNLETFFASFAQQMLTTDASTVAPPINPRRTDKNGNVVEEGGLSAVAGGKETATTENNMATMVVLGVGGVMLLLCFIVGGILVWCCWWKKKEEKKEEKDDEEKDSETEKAEERKKKEKEEGEERKKKEKEIAEKAEKAEKERKEADKKREEVEKEKKEIAEKAEVAEKEKKEIAGKAELAEKEKKELAEKNAQLEKDKAKAEEGKKEAEEKLDAELKKNADLAVKLLIDKYRQTEGSKKQVPLPPPPPPPVVLKPVSPIEKSLMVDKTQDSSRISIVRVPLNIVVACINILWDMMMNNNTGDNVSPKMYGAIFKSALSTANQNQPTAYETKLYKVNERKIRHEVTLMMVSRVVLRGYGADDDFIHFSRIRFTNGLRFLAGQSPQLADEEKKLVETVTRTWHMIRQERPENIVMFGKMVTQFGVQCAAYFPDELNQILEFDGIVVKCTSRLQERNGEVIVRKLHVQFTKHQTECHLTHYHYVAWEQGDCPLKTDTMIWLLKQVDREEQQVVVHCPDGIGATGVFCFIEMAVQHMMNDEQFNIMQVLLVLRQSRYGAIRTYVQLEFAVQTSLDYALDGHDLPEETATRLNRFGDCYRVSNEARAADIAAQLRVAKVLEARKRQYFRGDSIKAAKKRYKIIDSKEN